ncbi:MAG: zinc-ribbon domain-containing protein [Pseudorhodobacter sp.]
MRLICPNCDAQYEVDDSAIPEGGRDVQCSNCGHAWYQMPAGLAEDTEAEADLYGEDPSRAAAVSAAGSAMPAPDLNAPNISGAAPPPVEPDAQPDVLPDDRTGTGEADPRAQEPADLSADTALKPEPPADPDEEGSEPSRPAADVTIPRRALDESLLAVLKEEAEREASARRAEQRPIETQTEMGLEETGSAAALRDRLARLRAPEPDPEPEVTDRPAARRDLLPDIEEINSTLRASSENRPGEGDPSASAAPARSSSGFRSGFFLMLFLAVVAASAYVAAPRIIEQFPAAEGPMTTYVSGVNHLRAALDSLLQRATGGLQSLGGG